MASLRTAATVQADYDSVHASWLRALEAESYSRSDGGSNRSVGRPRSEVLFEQLRQLEREYQRLTGSGISIRPVTPIDE